MLRFPLIAAAILTSVGACTTLSHATELEPPAIFDKRSYADAKKAAEDGKKWFVVKATASWCPPCKRMDKTTWVDEKVIKWANANAVVVSLDVDEHAELAGKLAIEAMPTMIAFKDGKEFDRVVGYKGPAEMLDWLEGAAQGKKSIEAVKKKAQPKANGDVDIQERYFAAKSLIDTRKYDEAAAEFAWLWQHALEHDPAMLGVRLSFMASDMKILAERSPAAKRSSLSFATRPLRILKNRRLIRTPSLTGSC